MLVILLLPTLPLPYAGALSLPSYILVKKEFQILENRMVRAEENYLLNLPRLYSSITIYHLLPSQDLWELKAWCEKGTLKLENRRVEGGTEVILTISFTPPFSGRLEYGFSYMASGWVSGTGPKYEARLGGVRMERGDYPYENYLLTIKGPPGSRLFWYEPREAIPSADGLSLTYSTSVRAPGVFEGLLVTFYTSPAYYKLTLSEEVKNTGKGDCELIMNLLLFGRKGNHFASIVSSDPPVGSLYIDGENNFYASFGLKLAPGEKRRLKLELVWMVGLHDPALSPSNAGTLDDLPSGMEEYTKGREWWEVEELRPLALQLAGGERNLYLLCEGFLKWMDQTITYVPTERRQGALETYQKKKGDCDCFSDLFITLLRALGVPSRLSFGWTVEENGIGNHAWAEVYLPGLEWQPVDPTWSRGSEKYLFRMDPLHLCRGSRGLSSSDSYLSRIYRGGYPEVEPEEVSLTLLSAEEAFQEFLLSARSMLELAEKVGKGDPRLEKGREYLLKGQTEKRMEDVLLSLSLSMEILGERGKPLELPFWVPRWILVLLGVLLGVAVLLALVIWLVEKKLSYRPHLGSCIRAFSTSSFGYS